MNIKRIIDKYGRSIGYVILVIILGLWGIRSLNSYYEKEEKIKQMQAMEDQANEDTYQTTTTNTSYSTKSKSSYKTINSFVNYCNNREVENAYKMLTDECKKAKFPTIEDFETDYINNIYDVPRKFELTKWSTVGNVTTYIITLHGDVLATGGKGNTLQDYYTLKKDDKGFYKLNISSYIYGGERNLESTVNNINVKIGNIDIYEDHEEATITFTNNTSKTICLTGNTYRENIYLQNTKGLTYSSLNSEFDSEEIILEPNESQTYVVGFNRIFSPTNNEAYLVLSDVILDYQEYLNSNDKTNYNNRTNIKVKY